MTLNSVKVAEINAELIAKYKDKDPDTYEKLKILQSTYSHFQTEDLITWTRRTAIATAIMAVFTGLMALATFLMVLTTWLKP